MLLLFCCPKLFHLLLLGNIIFFSQLNPNHQFITSSLLNRVFPLSVVLISTNENICKLTPVKNLVLSHTPPISFCITLVIFM